MNQWMVNKCVGADGEVTFRISRYQGDRLITAGRPKVQENMALLMAEYLNLWEYVHRKNGNLIDWR